MEGGPQGAAVTAAGDADFRAATGVCSGMGGGGEIGGSGTSQVGKCSSSISPPYLAFYLVFNLVICLFYFFS